MLVESKLKGTLMYYALKIYTGRGYHWETVTKDVKFAAKLVLYQSLSAGMRHLQVSRWNGVVDEKCLGHMVWCIINSVEYSTSRTNFASIWRVVHEKRSKIR